VFQAGPDSRDRNFASNGSKFFTSRVFYRYTTNSFEAMKGAKDIDPNCGKSRHSKSPDAIEVNALVAVQRPKMS